MIAREYLNSIANGQVDLIQLMLDILTETRSPYCVIGGLAVNAYAEPVVSLDIDLVVLAENLPEVIAEAKKRGFRVEHFEHIVNLSCTGSDLRVQLQTDPQYQPFLARAKEKVVLGYPMQVAELEDVLQGKLRAYADETLRKSKRQKDLADILRLVEAHPRLKKMLPAQIRELT
jgi:uncharacterized protein (UPF0335 family)